MKSILFFLSISFFIFVLGSTKKFQRNNLEFFTKQYEPNIKELIENINNFEVVGENPTVCQQCEIVVEKFIKTRKSGANKKSMQTFLSDLCVHFLQYQPAVCQSFSDIEIDAIVYIIDNKDVKPKEFCGIYFQKDGCINTFAKKWTVNIPPRNVHDISYNTDQSSNSPLRIVHITDVHYDPLYRAGSNAKCDSPLCCEEKNGIPSNPENAAGTFGDHRACDMSRNSLINMLNQIKNSKQKIDFAYFTGDIIAHKNWETSKETNLETIEEFYDLLQEYLGNIKLFPILGNHEAHPCNLFAPLNVSSELISTNWLFEAVSKHWSKWLPASAIETVKLGGYYTVLIRPGFRIIAINSNVCFTENLWLVYNDEDEYGQLGWLVKTLLEAEKKKEKVHILSHVPPGEMKCHRQWQFNFNKIIQRFSKTISAQFNGHTHNDEIRIFKNENNSKEVINVAYNGGSFTTFVGLNPDYRVYEIEQANFMVSDYHQYTFNLSAANSQSSLGPNWYKIYSFKSAYGLKDMNYENLLKFNEKLTKDLDLAQQYVRFYVRDSEYTYREGCNETCLESQVCHITAIDVDSSIKCGSFEPI